MNLTATPNSRLRCPANRRLWGVVGFLVVLLLIVVSTSQAADSKAFVAYAESVLISSREQYQHEPTNSEAAWQFGRACFDRAEFATNATERATLAVQGIEAMRKLVAREPKLAAGHYYLAMNLGQFARTKLLGVLSIVDEMEVEFKTAREQDEHFDHAGPDRNLAQLYFQAPGWPASIGSHIKARKHFERALELAPDYPGNHLNLLEAYLHWKDEKGIQREVKAIKALWPEARTNFTGKAWASTWADWEARRAELVRRAGK